MNGERMFQASTTVDDCGGGYQKRLAFRVGELLMICVGSILVISFLKGFGVNDDGPGTRGNPATITTSTFDCTTTTSQRSVRRKLTERNYSATNTDSTNITDSATNITGKQNETDTTRTGAAPFATGVAGATDNPFLVLDLPAYTIESLKDPFTPQSQAYYWLVDSYGASTLLGMEEWRKQQLFVLASIYYSFGGDEWAAHDKQQWLDASRPECSWTPHSQVADYCFLFQIQCTGTGQLRSLRLDSFQNDLPGTFPPELELLTALELLSIQNSTLTGNRLDQLLPSTVTRLHKSFRHLYLDGNALYGTIPTFLGELTQLVSLYLGNDSLEGTLPSELGLLTQLQEMYFYGSRLTGSLPREISRMTSLVSVGLDNNFLEGSIPTELGLLTSMTFLNLGGNHLLSGTIPTELTMISHLKYLYLYDSDLSGTVPEALCLDKKPSPFSVSSRRYVWIDCQEVACPETCTCDCRIPNRERH